MDSESHKTGAKIHSASQIVNLDFVVLQAPGLKSPHDNTPPYSSSQIKMTHAATTSTDCTQTANSKLNQLNGEIFRSGPCLSLCLWKVLLKPSSKIFYWPFWGSASFMDNLCDFCLVLLCFRAYLFINDLWSPARKGLTSWLSFVLSNCKVVTFPSVSWVRWGAWLYRSLIIAPFHSLIGKLYRNELRYINCIIIYLLEYLYLYSLVLYLVWLVCSSSLNKSSSEPCDMNKLYRSVVIFVHYSIIHRLS